MLKRGFDILAVLLTAPFWVPVMLLVGGLVRVNLGRPIFFRQLRPGKNEQLFELIKFRTMRDSRDPSGNLRPDAERLTKFGRWLRASSLDELPELLNVLRGELSLVGPRPLLVEYLPLYDAQQRRRHSVTPGLTGLAQVNGRNALTWEEKFQWDIHYVEHRSFWLDLKILFRTVKLVLWRDGISAQGAATMPVFTGTGPKRPPASG